MLRDAVVVGEDRAGADVGALADLGVADVGQVRDLGAVADLGVLGLDERADLAAGAELGARAAGRRTGPTVAPAPIDRERRRGCGRRCAPSPTSTSFERACRARSRRPRPPIGGAEQLDAGQERDVAARASTSTSIQVVAGSTTVTPSRIQRSRVRAVELGAERGRAGRGR